MRDSCSDEDCASDFVVRMLAGTSGARPFISMIVLAFNGHEFIVASNSAIRIRNDSLSNLLPQLLSKSASIALAARICLCQISPK